MKTLATITLKVPQCSQGLHLRWYANGWHYATLKVGDESYLTAGLFSNTEANAKQRIAVEDVPAANLDALIALARVGSFDVLTPKGWRNGTFDGGDITTFETDANYYRAEFMLNVYGKTYPYSPIVIAGVDPIVLVYPLVPVEVLQGDTAVLPTTVKVKRESGAIADASVTWGNVDTSVAGSFVIYGVVAGADLKASVTITVKALTDLDILRQIRDANPTSQLPTLWSEDKDPYTEWWDANNDVGVLFGGDIKLDKFAMDYGVAVPPIVSRRPLKAYVLLINMLGVRTLQNIAKLVDLQYLDCNGNQLTLLETPGSTSLQYLDCSSNQLTLLGLIGLSSLKYLVCNNNQLTSILSLTSKGPITDANFTHNLMPPTETNRLRALGFTDAQLLPQDI